MTETKHNPRVYWQAWLAVTAGYVLPILLWRFLETIFAGCLGLAPLLSYLLMLAWQSSLFRQFLNHSRQPSTRMDRALLAATTLPATVPLYLAWQALTILWKLLTDYHFGLVDDLLFAVVAGLVLSAPYILFCLQWAIGRRLPPKPRNHPVDPS